MTQRLLLNRYLLNPFSTIETDNAPYGFRHLIEFQEKVDPERREPKNKSSQYPQWQRDYPQKNIICYHQHPGISTAP